MRKVSPWPMAIIAILVLILTIHLVISYTINVLHYDIILSPPWITFVPNGG